MIPLFVTEVSAVFLIMLFDFCCFVFFFRNLTRLCCQVYQSCLFIASEFYVTLGKFSAPLQRLF